MMPEMTISAATLLGLAWKSAAIAGATLLLLRLARARSSGERSMIAHSGLFALLALPAAILLLPQWAPLPAGWFAAAAPAVLAASDLATTGGPAADLAVPAATSVPVAADAGSSPPVVLASLGDAVPYVYAIPLLLLVGVMLLAVVRLFAMRGRAEVLVQPSWLSALAEAQRRMGFKHGTALLVSEELRSPISWGVLRPTIVLSPKAVAATGEAEAIIAHELAHVARLDWAKLLGARVACAVFWFNPFVWMLARESHQLREEAADDAVLMADIDGPDYATLLVGAARHDNKAALLAAHGVAPAKSSLKRRITRVLDGDLKRGPHERRLDAGKFPAARRADRAACGFLGNRARGAACSPGGQGACGRRATDRCSIVARGGGGEGCRRGRSRGDGCNGAQADRRRAGEPARGRGDPRICRRDARRGRADQRRRPDRRKGIGDRHAAMCGRCARSFPTPKWASWSGRGRWGSTRPLPAT